MGNPARLNHWGAPARWALAAGLFGCALAGRFLLIGALPPQGFPFLTFFPAVLLAAFLCGLWPGLGVALASMLSAWYWFILPGEAFVPLAQGDAIALVFFVCILVVDCVVLHVMNRGTMLLKERERELGEADRQKDLFIATLAHELRSPISAVLMAARVVQRESTPETRVARASQMIRRQGEQLARLVDDLLTATRLRTGKFDLRLDTIELRQVIDTALEAMQADANAADRELTLSVSDQPMTTRGDAPRLAQCLTNLLHNAVKFTGHGGTIHLSAMPEGESLVIVVSDDGEGIGAAALERIFQPFVQEAGERMAQGLGLGLALTRDIVVAHGGTVHARSAGKGRGTQVEMRLPRLLTAAVPGGTRAP
jgi:signal transduction histidine kinase